MSYAYRKGPTAPKLCCIDYGQSIASKRNNVHYYVIIYKLRQFNNKNLMHLYPRLCSSANRHNSTSDCTSYNSTRHRNGYQKRHRHSTWDTIQNIIIIQYRLLFMCDQLKKLLAIITSQNIWCWSDLRNQLQINNFTKCSLCRGLEYDYPEENGYRM